MITARGTGVALAMFASACGRGSAMPRNASLDRSMMEAIVSL